MPTIYVKTGQDYAQMLEAAGLSLVESPANADYAVCTTEYSTLDFVEECAPYGNLHINHEAIDKRVLASTFASLGFEVIPHIPLTSRQSIDDVPWVPFFSKPSWAAGRLSPSTFDYVTYRNKEAAYAAFDADTSGTLNTRNAILQPSYAAMNGRTDMLICSASVNGAGVISMEPVISVTHKENYGHFYSAVRGGSEQMANAAECKDAVRSFIQHSGLKNTHILVQFLNNGVKYLPMDLAYRLDYHSMYVIPKLGTNNQHHVNRIRFAYDLDQTPPLFDGVTSLRFIDVRPEVNAAQVQAAMQAYDIKFLNAFSGQRYRMFGNTGASKESVLAAMNSFEAEIGNA